MIWNCKIKALSRNFLPCVLKKMFNWITLSYTNSRMHASSTTQLKTRYITSIFQGMVWLRECLPLLVLNLGLKILPWNLSSCALQKVHKQFKETRAAGKQKRWGIEPSSQLSLIRVRWKGSEGFTKPHREVCTCLFKSSNKNSKSNYSRLPRHQPQMTAIPEHQEVLWWMPKLLQSPYRLLSPLGFCYDTLPLKRALNFNTGEYKLIFVQAHESLGPAAIKSTRQCTQLSCTTSQPNQPSCKSDHTLL